jgi:hypothetical protein
LYKRIDLWYTDLTMEDGMSKINWTKFTGHCRSNSALWPKAFSWPRWARAYVKNEMCTEADLARWSKAAARQPSVKERELLIKFMDEVGLPYEDQAAHFASLEGDYCRAAIAFARRLEDWQDLTASDWVYVQRIFVMMDNSDFRDQDPEHPLDPESLIEAEFRKTFAWLEPEQLGDDNIYDSILS